MKISKKIVLLGHFGVGKTSLIRRFIDNEFDSNYQVTIGVQVKKKEVSIKKDTVTLMIWDIEGNTSIKKARNSYLLGASGLIYVFDVTRPETYSNLVEEINYLNENYPEIPIITIGNKEDISSLEGIKSYLKNNNLEITAYSSAKTGKNVSELFIELSQLLLQNES